MNVRAAPATAGREPLRQHLHDVVEFLPAQVAIRVGGTHALVENVFIPFLTGRRCHDLLGQDVERLVRNDQSVEPALTRRAEHRRALDQLIPRQREHPPLGNRAEPVSRPADALQQRADRAGRTHLNDEIDAPDIDAQLE